jgi:hypothetical protein
VVLAIRKSKPPITKNLDIGGYAVTVKVGRILDMHGTPLNSYEAVVLGKPLLGKRTILAATAYGATAKEALEFLKATLTQALEENAKHVKNDFAFAQLSDTV